MTATYSENSSAILSIHGPSSSKVAHRTAEMYDRIISIILTICGFNATKMS